MAEQSGRRNDRTKSLVGFMVGDIHYAVSIGRVREIINPLPIVELPHPPPTVIGVAHSVPSLESRLTRDLNRRRPIVTPLPQRDHHEPEAEELSITKRVSRYARDLGH